FRCRLIHLKIILWNKPLEIGLCNKADQNYGLEYVGLGASLLFFIKTSKFDANKTPQLLNELSNFYQFNQTTHNQLEQHLSNHEYLILPYVESLEVFDLD
ncbi:hypothetical protein RFH60_05755, partial [Acinetobacter baumannii]|nr:hypothetical protein [Acinetobacter baumannii]MDQ9001969.1 hypothetical protein [Acinetobacter baumannii]